MEEKSRCIVLKAVKYGDNKLIADLLCRECGRVSVILPFGERRTAPTGRLHRYGGGKAFSRSLFQPLTILDAELRGGQRQSLARLCDARMAVVYTSIPFDGVKLSLAFFIAEFLSFSTRDLHRDPLLYDFAEQSLEWLDAAEHGIANFHLMFMMHMTRFLGFYPDLESFSQGAFFDLREGCFCPYAPCHSDFLTPEDAGHIRMLMRMTPANLHLFRLTRTERNRITDCCLLFYRLHIPAFGDMKTPDVLRAL